MTKSKSSRSGFSPKREATTLSEASGPKTTPKSTRRKAASKGFRRMTPRDPIQEIKDALEQTLSAAAYANNAAVHLNTVILNDRTTLAAEAAIVRDATTLLQHLMQTFSRRALLQLEPATARGQGHQR